MVAAESNLDPVESTGKGVQLEHSGLLTKSKEQQGDDGEHKRKNRV